LGIDHLLVPAIQIIAKILKQYLVKLPFFREQYLLIDPSTATARAVQLAAVVSAHELAHQWFGNLVTMDW
jgi:pantothenate kinase type III